MRFSGISKFHYSIQHSWLSEVRVSNLTLHIHPIVSFKFLANRKLIVSTNKKFHTI